MFERITLEMSLKPFFRTDESFITEVCRNVFTSWRPLLKNRKTISVMLWTADGSEILDWAGDPDAGFEWAKYCGTANEPDLEEGASTATHLHDRRQLYRADAPAMTYRTLARIVSCIKRTAKEMYPEAEILVGETFDIGPEFAFSSFKYVRHKEICGHARMNALGLVDSTALLHADDRAYAAYPHGIPEGLPFAEFLGRQTRLFFGAMGFDYLWLSNGLGFSADPWDATGKIFDGTSFHPEKLEDTRNKVFGFWTAFRAACPDIPVETRGTNYSAGIDYATDGVPLKELYDSKLGFVPPPNSPWAAIDRNYGLEIMGHMSRVCAWPGNEFPFRYYLHDPWWMNSPWYDRYEGNPSDIYLPMAISRIGTSGNIETADRLNILSIDNSHGDMPDACINEPLPHLLKAEKDVPDAPGPLVWVYPAFEYTESRDETELAAMYAGDRFIMDCINGGLPLSCVLSSDRIEQMILFKGCVFICPEMLAEQVRRLAGCNGVISYSGSDSTPQDMLDALARTGYRISFKKKHECRVPVMTFVPRDNGFVFSAWTPDTTVETTLSFPMGSPVMLGGECETGFEGSTYRFARSEHRECRVFVTQASGVVSAQEYPPVNMRYRRKIAVYGLDDAFVRFYPEKEGCRETVASRICGDMPPVPLEGWRFAEDEMGMTYMYSLHVSGDIAFCMV